MFWLPRGHFSTRFGSQEGSLSCFNQPRGQFSVFCQPRGHFGMLFWLPRRHLSSRFGSQEGTLAHVFQQLGHEGGRPCPSLFHITAVICAVSRDVIICRIWIYCISVSSLLIILCRTPCRKTGVTVSPSVSQSRADELKLNINTANVSL